MFMSAIIVSLVLILGVVIAPGREKAWVKVKR
jgi:hypothetical protein